MPAGFTGGQMMSYRREMKINFSVKSEPSMLCKKLCRPSVTALSYVSCCALEVPSPTQDPLWNFWWTTVCKQYLESMQGAQA